MEDDQDITIDDVKNIEEQLNKSMEAPTETPLLARERLSQKDELINEILSAQSRIKEHDKSFKTVARSTLKRYSIERLQEILGNCLNHGITQSTTAVPNLEIKNNDNDPQATIVANGLFNMNLMLSTILEQATKSIDYSPVCIDGYCKNLQEKKDELLVYFRAIYYEHKEVLSKYISPINMIIMINCTAVLPAIKNKKQVLIEEVKEEQKV